MRLSGGGHFAHLEPSTRGLRLPSPAPPAPLVRFAVTSQSTLTPPPDAVRSWHHRRPWTLDLAAVSSHTTRLILTRLLLRSLHAVPASPAYPPIARCDTTPHDSTHHTAPLLAAPPDRPTPRCCSCPFAPPSAPAQPTPALVDLVVASRPRHLPTAGRSALHAPIATSPRAIHLPPLQRVRVPSVRLFLDAEAARHLSAPTLPA